MKLLMTTLRAPEIVNGEDAGVESTPFNVAEGVPMICSEGPV